MSPYLTLFLCLGFDWLGKLAQMGQNAKYFTFKYCIKAFTANLVYICDSKQDRLIA